MSWRVQWSDVLVMPAGKARGSLYSLAKRGSQVVSCYWQPVFLSMCCIRKCFHCEFRSKHWFVSVVVPDLNSPKKYRRMLSVQNVTKICPLVLEMKRPGVQSGLSVRSLCERRQTAHRSELAGHPVATSLDQIEAKNKWSSASSPHTPALRVTARALLTKGDRRHSVGTSIVV
jgi:hypothetical protein